ncbi:MAG: hypothetical protein ACXW29_02615 [Thermoanaerobaculia bacterium]
MIVRLGQIIERTTSSWWRFAPAATLVLLVALIARAHYAPIVMAAPPAMIRTGVADRLAKQFFDDTGLRVQVDSVPGLALTQRVANVDLDIAFAHDPRYLAALGRHALRTRQAFTAEYVLVGPAEDSADVWNAHSAREAFHRIAVSHARFQSSPRTSAAFAIEEALWHASGIAPPPSTPASSVESAFAAASRWRAYMLIDRPTYERLFIGRNLMELFARDPELKDVYYVAELSGVQDLNTKLFWHWFGSAPSAAATSESNYRMAR